MALTCSRCSAQMPETAAFCPGCGRRVRKPDPSASQKAVVFAENVAGALAYLTFVPAILFLVLKPYKTKGFVRFHSVQCLLLWGAGGVLALALKLAIPLFFLIPLVGPFFELLIYVVVALAAVLLWLVLIVKALLGEQFQVPLLGEFAAEYSGDSRP